MNLHGNDSAQRDLRVGLGAFPQRGWFSRRRVAPEAVAACRGPGPRESDAEVVAAANERGIAMVLTGVRHFRH